MNVLTTPEFKHEWALLPDNVKEDSVKLLNLYAKMCARDHDPFQTWVMLHGGYKDLFRQTHVYCKAAGLRNMASFWGRKYNMFFNLPESFESYRGRIYRVSY